jgi:hypothetical protein
MPDSLTHNDFQGRTGDTFTAKGQDGQELALEMTDVEVPDPGPDGHPDGHRSPFWVEFVGAEHLPQQTFSVEHAELGTFDLFLVPLGPSDKGMRYEAVFG